MHCLQLPAGAPDAVEAPTPSARLPVRSSRRPGPAKLKGLQSLPLQVPAIPVHPLSPAVLPQRAGQSEETAITSPETPGAASGYPGRALLGVSHICRDDKVLFGLLQ